MPDARPGDGLPRSLEQGLAAAEALRQRGDVPGALGLLSTLRARFPHSPIPFQRAASALLAIGSPFEAEVLLDTAAERFPGDPWIAIDRAWLAHRQGDAAETARRWAAVRNSFPDNPAGYTGAISTSRDNGHFDAAEALLAEAKARFPDNPATMAEDAWMAVARRDHAAAAARWGVVRERWPDMWLGYVGTATALRALGQFDAAETALREAASRFPEQMDVWTEFAQLAMARADWPEARDWWARARIRFPGVPAIYAGEARALRELGRWGEAELVLGDAALRFPGVQTIAADYAMLAQLQRDWPGAARRWERMRRIFPGAAAGYMQGAAVADEAGHTGEADALLHDAVVRFPGQRSIGHEYARVAQARGDWAEAARRWNAARGRAPDDHLAWLGEARCLGELGQHDAAAALLRDAVRCVPGVPDPMVELGHSARRRGDHTGAIAIWETLRQRFPEHHAGYTSGAAALRAAHRPAEAAALTDDALRRFPDALDPLIEHAWLAVDATDHIEAEHRFRRARDRHPAEPAGWLGLARAMAAQGRPEAARIVLAEAIRRFPRLTSFIEERDRLPPDPEARTGPPVTAPAVAKPAPLVSSPASRLPVGRIAKPIEIRVTVRGYHLAEQINQIFQRMRIGGPRLLARRIEPGVSLDTLRAALPPNWLETTDLYCEESMAGPGTYRADIRTALGPQCETRSFSTPSMLAPWPFAGPDPRLVPEPGYYPDGRYPDSDRVAARLAGLDLSDDALFDTYMAMSEEEELDLDGLLERDIARWRDDDERHDIPLAAFLRGNFQERRLFTTPNEHGPDVILAIARGLFGTAVLSDAFGAAALDSALERLTRGWRAAGLEIPVHPRVARHFNLTWWAPDLRYRFRGNDLTLRDYVLRYIRWTPWAP